MHLLDLYLMLKRQQLLQRAEQNVSLLGTQLLPTSYNNTQPINIHEGYETAVYGEVSALRKLQIPHVLISRLVFKLDQTIGATEQFKSTISKYNDRACQTGTRRLCRCRTVSSAEAAFVVYGDDPFVLDGAAHR